MNESDSPLNQEFAQAADNHESFDFGFEKQRADCGFSNFNFPPDEAAAMRERELARIAKEWEDEPMDYDEFEDEDDDFDYEDDDDFDRFSDSVGGGDDWVEDEDWDKEV